MLHRSMIALVLLSALYLPATVLGQYDDDSNLVVYGPPPPVPPAVVTRDEEGRKTVRAIRIDQPIDLDGTLDDEVYARVPAVSGFLQQEPHEFEPATEETEVWILFDDENVYISARCWNSQPDRMVMNEMRRDSDNIYQNESLSIILDTFYDRRNGFFFQTNPLGALRDQSVTDEGLGINKAWNTVWDVKARLFPEGWTVEVVIPFKSLRYKRASPQNWGINIRRMVTWKNETSYLNPVGASHQWRGMYKLSSAATLVGVEPPLESRNLELKPYAISDVTTNNNADPPYTNDLDGAVGIDLKYGLTNSLIADFTVNTDFAQVEEDDVQVNLTRFSLYFPEKREFFLEGQGIFAFGGVELRGIYLNRADEDNPALTPIMFFSRRIGLSEEGTVPILVGGRVTGRAGAYRIGALNIQTGESDSGVERPTNYSVFRLRRDILRRSDIGVIGTYRTRSLESPEQSNGVVGVDANFAFYENLRFNTYYAMSRTSELDDSRDDQESYLAKMDYTADRYGLILEHLYVGENFKPELGFLSREAFRRDHAQVRFSPRPQSIRAIRRLIWELDVDYITDPVGTLESRRVRAAFRTENESGDETRLEYSRNYEFLAEGFEIADDVVIPTGGYNFQSLRAVYQFGPQRAVPGYVTLRTGSFYSGDRTELVGSARIEVTPQFSLEPRFAVNWVDLEEGAFTDKLVGARVSYTLSPRMAVSSLIQYNSASDALGASVRYRWEYQPGSDLFVVYSEGRETDVHGFPQLANRTFAVKFTRLFRF
jgi:hypothetical protein